MNEKFLGIGIANALGLTVFTMLVYYGFKMAIASNPNLLSGFGGLGAKSKEIIETV